MTRPERSVAASAAVTARRDPISKSPPQSWEDVSGVYAENVRAYHARAGRDVSAPSVDRTVRINTELVPKRGDNLLDLLEDLGDARLEGKRVLEVGCGFGALAAYLAW